MTRRTSTGRVGGGGDPRRPSSEGPPSFPSMRERRPVVFWIVILATAALVLGSIAGFLSAIL